MIFLKIFNTYAKQYIVFSRKGNHLNTKESRKRGKIREVKIDNNDGILAL